MITFSKYLSCFLHQSSNHLPFSRYKNWSMFPLLHLCRVVLLYSSSYLMVETALWWMFIPLTFAVCNPRLVPETEVSESYTHCTGTAENTLMLLYIQVYDWILASVPPANPQHYLLILSRIVRSIWLNYPHGTGVIHSLTDTSVSTFQPLS